jgi:hypothetical protein
MVIKNTEGLSGNDIRRMVDQGGKFVIYKYCISIILMTFNNPTDVYFIHPGKSRITPSLGYLFMNTILGWWGIPWGPIYTIGNIYTCLSGGKDITIEVLNQINQNDSSYGTGTNYNIPGTAAQYDDDNPNTPPQPNTYNVPNNNQNINNVPK